MGKSHSPAVDIVRNRSEGRCEICGVVLTQNVNGIPDGDTARSIHHRQPKRCGGRDSVINLVNLCVKHHREIHDDEETAAGLGYIVIGRHPGRVPFLSWRGWVVPEGDGALTLLDWASGRTRPLAPAPTTRRPRVARRPRHRSRQVA